MGPRLRLCVAHPHRDLRLNPLLCGVAPAGLGTRCAMSGVTCWGQTGLWACAPATPDGFRCFIGDGAPVCAFGFGLWNNSGSGAGWVSKGFWNTAGTSTPALTFCGYLWGLYCNADRSPAFTCPTII